MKPAIFLDRDGVIIENRPSYVRRWEDVHIYPQALDALSCLSKSLFKIVIVTNQSAVGRGIMTLEEADAINQQLLYEIELAGGRIDGLYMCPHAPEEQCACRKPHPGLILQAAKELDIDLSVSVLIGDAWSDLQAGFAAGIPRLVLVQTGRGKEQLSLPRPKGLDHYFRFDTLAKALREIC